MIISALGRQMQFSQVWTQRHQRATRRPLCAATEHYQREDLHLPLVLVHPRGLDHRHLPPVPPRRHLRDWDPSCDDSGQFSFIERQQDQKFLMMRENETSSFTIPKVKFTKLTS